MMLAISIVTKVISEKEYADLMAPPPLINKMFPKILKLDTVSCVLY